MNEQVPTQQINSDPSTWQKMRRAIPTVIASAAVGIAAAPHLPGADGEALPISAGDAPDVTHNTTHNTFNITNEEAAASGQSTVQRVSTATRTVILRDGRANNTDDTKDKESTKPADNSNQEETTKPSDAGPLPLGPDEGSIDDSPLTGGTDPLADNEPILAPPMMDVDPQLGPPAGLDTDTDQGTDTGSDSDDQDQEPPNEGEPTEPELESVGTDPTIPVSDKQPK